jgi:murein DD-endopeptidase MepM/ murein hydrolase activator NlpD
MTVSANHDRWLWVAIATAAMTILGGGAAPLAAGKPGPTAAASPAPTTPDVTGGAECPPGTAPDGDACVHLTLADDGPVAEARENGHRERSGRWSTYEQIPRLPDRPPDYDAYRYPIPPGLPGGHYVVSGYDLDQPDAKQRRGLTLRHVGHGAVDLPQTKGTPVRMIALEHQEGDAEVLYASTLFGLTVLTRHTVREGGHPRDYLMLLGHLDTIAAGIHPGTTVHEGDLVATVGDSGSPSLVHLHLEIRRVREGIDLVHVPAGAPMLAEAVTVVCDPRNLLPLK